MKRKLITAVMLILVSANLFAQGRIAEQYFINGAYGYVMERDGIDAGSMGKISVGKLFGDYYWLGKAEISYQDYDVFYSDNQILPYNKYTLSIYGGYSYEDMAPVYLNAWLGGYVGKEEFNKGNEMEPKYDTKIPTNVKGITYGVTGSAEVEVMVLDGFSLTVDYTQYYDFRSKFSKANFGLFGGLRYYINN